MNPILPLGPLHREEVLDGVTDEPLGIQMIRVPLAHVRDAILTNEHGTWCLEELPEMAPMTTDEARALAARITLIAELIDDLNERTSGLG